MPAAPVKKSKLPAVRSVDAKARVLLPKQFAGATVTVEAVSDSEVVIRRAVVVAESAWPAADHALQPLSAADRDAFLRLLDHPPKPNKKLLAAAARYKKNHARHGR